MKERTRKAASAIGLISLAGFFTFGILGCGGLGIPNLGQIFPGGSGGAAIVGTWKTMSVTDGTSTVDCPGTLVTSSGSYNCYQEVRSYLPTGTWTTTAPANLIATGSWTVNGTDLTVKSDSGSFTGPLSFSADGNTYTWTVAGISTIAKRQ